MPYYAQKDGSGRVFSVSQTSLPLAPAENVIEIDSLDDQIVGKIYDAEASATAGRPVFVDAPAVEQSAPAGEWLIDIGPFFDRFGPAKMAVLTSADPGVQAILKDTQIRKWLDLKLPEVAQSVTYVGTKVPAVTAELQDAILNTPVAPDENLALRKLYF